ncbi:DUF6177 family protein [Nocardiopsis exhalans]|uniref:DUF6177 family protein n=1 Tax=Nocardiopsis exhalans TaxID=163604 RepID=A0ABY5DBT1_9ACTN|nr:DUF6177 family protein [Nocardiopsis exhalans]USY20503.1 DUF6177 family protein [Nocardiopsis exhalans]
MTYDAVALVTSEPDTQAFATVLSGLDPNLLLREHDHSGVLEVLDADGVHLAAIEPGQVVDSTDEIVRLLSDDMLAGLTLPCWWVEVRARPDESGRHTAHQLVDSLALRLGGQVWTSGNADFGLWEEFRPEEGTRHPALERRREHALLIAQDRRVVPLSSWITDSIATQAENRIVQVVTPASARLTHGLRTFLTGPRGRWVVQDDGDGHFDGVTGLPLTWHEEHGFAPFQVTTDGEGNVKAAKGDGPPEAVPGFLDDDPLGTQLLLDLAVTHREASAPKLGWAARTVAETLTGHPPSGWGPHEPALYAWNPELIRLSVLHQGPKPLLLHFSGSQEATRQFGGSLSYRWDRLRVTERMTMAIGFQDEEDVPFEVLPELVSELAAEGLLDGFRVSRFRGRADLTYEPRWQGTVVPVGIAVGPERLERMGVDQARAGPIKATFVGHEDKSAAWYPVVTDTRDQNRAHQLIRAQETHLASATRH